VLHGQAILLPPLLLQVLRVLVLWPLLMLQPRPGYLCYSLDSLPQQQPQHVLIA
jgi:hypothetical protein